LQGQNVLEAPGRVLAVDPRNKAVLAVFFEFVESQRAGSVFRGTRGNSSAEALQAIARYT
jgi:hypothetical protein